VHSQQTEVLFNEFRHRLGVPDLPIVQVAITCQSHKAPLSKELNAQQKSMSLHNVVTIDAAQLTLQEDGLHLDLQSNVLLGELLGAAFLESFGDHLQRQMQALGATKLPSPNS
jgi:hypothetical protein